MYYMVISNTAAPGSQALASHAVTAFGHELGHAFGAMSNLVDTNHGENCVMSRDCKMDKIYGSAVEGKTIFCTSCASQITSKTVS